MKRALEGYCRAHTEIMLLMMLIEEGKVLIKYNCIYLFVRRRSLCARYVIDVSSW